MNPQLHVFALAVLGAGLLLAAAGCEPQSGSGTAEVQEHAAAHLDPEYVCPMHPDVTSDEPGRCPICGMDLVREKPDSASTDRSGEVLYYRHPHNPEIRSDVPMKDEMGMDYVPVFGDEDGGGITVSPEVRHNLGVRTAPAEYGELARYARGVGFVGWNEDRLRHVHARAEGWVERWNVGAVGDAVEKGDVLFELYSPAMATAEEEFLQALKMDNARLVSAAERKLRALGISKASVARLRRTREAAGRIPFYAEADGVVVELAAREGMFVRPMTDVLVIADLSEVWVEAEIPASRAGWLRVGLPAAVTVESVPGRVWRGELTWVYPEVDPVSRAQRVRLEFGNSDGVLLPNAWAAVTITEPSPSPVVHIPREAVIRSGTGERVVVETAGGRFVPRLVQTGYESNGRIVVLAGLEPGEQVVTSGQFLLDSEASLRGELERLAPPDPADPHAGHDMGNASDAVPRTDHARHDMSGTGHSGHDMPGMDSAGPAPENHGGDRP
ncbi:MAG: efflux RND transporter periplasmic adaptor subunit [Gammaproteobacteria bacterium]